MGGVRFVGRYAAGNALDCDMMKQALEFVNVSSGYHGVSVLTQLDLAVQEGEMVGLLGPNGAGKTTILRCITGLCPATEGHVSLFGADIGRLAAAERAALVAVVPQELTTPMPFTVQELVMIGRTASLSRLHTPSSRDKAIVDRAMVYTDVVDMKNRPFTELSGGEKQRVIVGMALAQEPRMILMDEATSHLDMNHRLEIMQIVERLNSEQGVTIIMISHDLNLAAEFCQRLILIDHGRIVSDGTPASVLNEDILRRVYHCDVRVQNNPADGSVTVVPAPRLAPGISGRGVRIHVICGGGSGEEVLRRLSLCDYSVTCGVLNQGDSDAEVATALELDVALETPFSPVGQASLNAAHEMVSKSDAVILCGVPFGPGNVVNLELAEQALTEKKPVFLREGINTRDYTPGHDAERKVDALAEKGASTWNNITNLLSLLPTRNADTGMPCR